MFGRQKKQQSWAHVTVCETTLYRQLEAWDSTRSRDPFANQLPREKKALNDWEFFAFLALKISILLSPIVRPLYLSQACIFHPIQHQQKAKLLNVIGMNKTLLLWHADKDRQNIYRGNKKMISWLFSEG